MNKLIALFLSLLTALPVYGAGPVIWSGSGAQNISSGPVFDRNTPYIKQPETNYISNGNGSINTTGWTTSGAITVTRVTSGLPRAVTEGTGLSLAAGSATHYAEFCFSIDASDKNTKMQWTFSQAPASYTSGDFRIEAYSYATAACGSSPTELSLSTDNPSTLHTPLQNFTGSFLPTSFDTTSADFYGIRFVRVAGASTLVISNVIVGPGNIIAVPAIGPWQDYTPTVSPISGYSSGPIGKFRRVGDSVEVYVYWIKNGVAGLGAGTLTVTIPPNMTINTSASASVVGLTTYGYMSIIGATFESFRAAMYASATTVNFGNGAALLVGTSMAASAGTEIRFTVPINEFAGAPNFAGQNDVEYGFNTSGITAAGTSNTTAFGYGPAGAAIGSIASTTPTGASSTSFTVRFLTPIQATDSLSIEINDGFGWIPVSGMFVWNVQGAARYGVRLIAPANSTDVVVSFANGGAGATGGSYAASGEAWSVFSAFRWRVVKSRAGVAQAFGLATATQSGLVQYQEQDLNISSSGDFSAGQPVLRISRVNKLVTLSWENLAHTSGAEPQSATGFIPVAFRPSHEVANLYNFNGSIVRRARITSAGFFILLYRDWAGTGTAQTSSDNGTMSWVLD